MSTDTRALLGSAAVLQDVNRSSGEPRLAPYSPVERALLTLLSVAALVLLIWETLTTLDEEVALVWTYVVQNISRKLGT